MTVRAQQEEEEEERLYMSRKNQMNKCFRKYIYMHFVDAFMIISCI